MYRPVPAQVDLPALEREVLDLVAGARRLRALAGRHRRRPAVRLLRGPADRQRHARHPPRRGAGVQGRVPALPHHEGLPRPAQGRLGLPRPAGRDRGREGARLHRQGRHRGVRRRRVQRALPRVGRAPRRRVRADDRAHGLLGRHVAGVPDHGPRLRRQRLVVAAADPRQGPAGPGPPGRALLPALRHRACPTTSSPRATRPSSTRRSTCDSRCVDGPLAAPAPPCWSGRPRRGRSCRTPPSPSTRRVDYVVARVGRRAARRRAAAARRGARRATPRCTGDAGRDLVGTHYAPPFTLVDVAAAAADDAGRRNVHSVLPADYVTVDDGTGLVHLAPAFGADDLAVGRTFGLPVVNPIRPDGHFAADVPLVGGAFFKKADESLVADLAERGLLFRRAAVRARLPALLALPHAAHVLRAAVLVHPHHRGQGRPPARERGHPAGTRTRSSTAGTATGWPTTSTGHCPATATGAPRCRSGAVPSGHLTVVGSRAELGELAGRDLTDLDPHRPFVDEITFPLPHLLGSDHAGPRGDRRLVRLRRDAVCPARLPAGATVRRSSSSTPPTTSARPSTRRAAGSTR